jgi:hypothetical protein
MVIARSIDVRHWTTGTIVVALLLASPAAAEAYVGPGAGFVLVSSFLTVFTTVLLTVLSLIVWPFRRWWRLRRRRLNVG